MESNYYTPEIDEFHFGFEYEIFEDFDHYNTKEWHKQSFSIDGINHESMDYIYDQNTINNKVRVKKLDMKDIEESGFSWVGAIEQSPNVLFRYGKHELLWNHNGRCVIELYSKERENNYIAYVGYIKNKSKLKMIMKDIGII